MKYFPFYLFLTLFSNSYLATSHLIFDLFNSTYSSEIYSGYLDTDISGNKLFYIFTPAQSPQNKSLPVILWLNGGPSCSALLGLLTEIGPVCTDLYSNNFTYNNYSWNLNYNLLFIDTPAGVGLSITNNKTQEWNDTKFAISSYKALKDFFNEFIDYKNNDFYLAGESYAGVYIPNLAKVILESEDEDKINLIGVIIGNGITDWNVDYINAVNDFSYNHAIYSKELYEFYLNECKPQQYNYNIFKEENVLPFDPPNVTHKCNEILQKFNDLYDQVDVYGIYRKCKKVNNNTYINNNSFIYKNTVLKSINRRKKIYFEKIINKYNLSLNQTNLNKNNNNELEPAIDFNPICCQDDPTVENFLNSPLTRKKLFIDNSTQNWTQCNDDVYMSYKEGDSIFFYQEFMEKYPNLRVWFFSGDADACVPTLGTLRWINKLGLKVEIEWRKWFIDEQQVGMIQKYTNGLVFLSIKGAGHMVPQDNRKAAKVMIDAFIKGEMP